MSWTNDDEDNLEGRITWVSNSNQFFNSTLVAESQFNSADLEVQVPDVSAPYLKRAVSKISIPYGHSAQESFAMQFYVGPNEYDRLAAMGHEIEKIIPFGMSSWFSSGSY